MSPMNRMRYALAALLVSAGFAAAEAAAQCVSELRPMSLRGTQPNRPVGPVAWSGERLGILRIENETNALYFSTLDTNFNQLSADVQLSATSLADSYFLLWNGVDFGLFYRTTDNEVVLQRISATGTPIGGRIFVTPSHGFFSEDEIDIVWDPYRGRYLILRTITQGPEKGMWLSQLDRDATVHFDRMLYYFFNQPALPEVVAGADKSIGIFFVHQLIPGLSMFRLNAENQQSFPVQLTAVTPRDVVTASAGNRFGVATWMNATGGKTEIRWQVVGTNGATLVSDRTLFPPRGIDVRPVDLTFANNEWALSYVDAIFGFAEQEGDLRLRRYTDNGSLNSDTVFSHERLRSTFLTRYAPVWTGTSYVTAVSFFVSRFEGSDSYLLRHCPLIGVPAVDVPYGLILSPVTFHATASGGSPAYSYEWDFGDRSLTQFGATSTHKYERPGTYTITLTTTDTAGARHISTMTLKVLAGVKRRSVGK
jgi:hypothetical protein